MPGSHIELTIGSEPSAFETITGALTIEGFRGFWEDGNTLRAYISEEQWRSERLEPLRAAISRIARNLDLPPPSVTLASIAPENWNRSWEETIRPIRATSRIVIAPTWHPFNGGPEDIVITIDPKMSFGTGYHETTRLMLLLLENHCKPGTRVLDAGTGTGILAIAAVKLGAASAIGFDIDEWSFDNACENTELNGVSGSVTIRRGDLSAVPESGFDLIAANIQKNVIEEMLPGLAARLVHGGTLLLSGLLAADRTELAALIAGAGFSITGELCEGEWIAFAAGRR